MVITLLLEKENQSAYIVFLVFVGLFICVVIYGTLKLIELTYVRIFKKPLIVHFHLFKRRLKENQIQILNNEFSFYKRLKPKYQRIFEHRVAKFIDDKEFIGRDGFEITDTVKLIVSATGVMLTFGYRHYLINSIEKVIIYPKVFYSHTNDDEHKGEFNPMLKAIVFSWEDFKHGYKISNDNLNLGIHEFVHAIHIDNMRNYSESAIVFEDGFNSITNYLEANEPLRQKLMKSDYIRDYAYTNQFEFLAVIIETFIETPKEFRVQFPELYKRIKRMLNFNFASY